MEGFQEALVKRKELRHDFDQWVFDEAAGKRPNKTAKKQESSVWLLRADGNYHNTLDAVTLTLSQSRYDRLSNQYQGKDETLASDLELLLLRYAPLSKGLQAAVPLAVCQLLNREWEASCECFSSPLNFNLASFCSAFPEDAVFGSMGSFFDFFPTEGSFEVNPPFTAISIERAFVHMTKLLQSDGGAALQFIVIVPSWKNQDCWKMLSNSPFNARSVSLKVREHVYVHSSTTASKDPRLVRGVEHRSTNGTTVFFLQNEAARSRYVISDVAVKGLRAAFGEERLKKKKKKKKNGSMTAKEWFGKRKK